MGTEAGVLKTGGAADILEATANATATNKARVIAIDAANGDIRLSGGKDQVIAKAIANSENGEAEAFGIFGG